MGVDVPEVRYARGAAGAVAFQTVGDGPHEIVFAPQLTDLYLLWKNPRSRAFLDRLAQDARLVVFNPRGTGLSDRPRSVTLESRMDDIGSVLDAAEIPRASLFGVSTGANACALFAATFHERTERLILAAPYPRAIPSETYPWGYPREGWLDYIRETRERWGDREYLREFLLGQDPAASAVFDEFEVWQLRLAVSPGAAADFFRLVMETDITDILGAIRVPTLILHRSDEGVTSASKLEAQYVAERIPDSRTRPLRSDATPAYSIEAAEAILDFLRGDEVRSVPGSVLATVLFTDIVESTEHAASLGDRAWSELLHRHHSAVRRELSMYRGVEVDTAGDGFFCRFDGPARAIACARQIVEDAGALGLNVRAGIHTGECELLGDKIAGIAVVTGSRISSLAAPGEVLISSTVKDLVAGSGFSFEDRGEQQLKGVPGSWRLHAVVPSQT